MPPCHKSFLDVDTNKLCRNAHVLGVALLGVGTALECVPLKHCWILAKRQFGMGSWLV